MNDLTPPDSHYLNAAAGWCELGNCAEARAEFKRISPVHRDHPAVLETEWQLCAAERDWLSALEAARRHIETAPQNPSGWIHQSYSLHEMKLTREAWNQLLAVADRFPGVSTIAYNLACYACQLGDREEARPWLKRAIKSRSEEEIKRLALSDPDLRPMWEDIRKL